jgi:hypothetical protein
VRPPPPQLAGEGDEASRPIPAVHLRSDGPILNNPGPTLAVRLESDGPGPLPPHPAFLSARPRLSAARVRSAHPAPPVSRSRPLCPPGPACQPLALALPARPRLSAACVRSAHPAPPVSRPRLRALARLPADLILSVDPRSDGRRSPIPLRTRNFLKRPPVFCNLTRRPWNFAVRSSDLLFNPE